MKFKFVQSGKTSGDETTPYTVSLNQDCSVGEFIDCVLKRGEWGYIRIMSLGHIFGSPECEYRNATIVYTEFTKEDLSQMVAMALASGGWSRMDYLLILK